MSDGAPNYDAEIRNWVSTISENFEGEEGQSQILTVAGQEMLVAKRNREMIVVSIEGEDLFPQFIWDTDEAELIVYYHDGEEKHQEPNSKVAASISTWSQLVDRSKMAEEEYNEDIN
jgi:hypothetical protein